MKVQSSRGVLRQCEYRCFLILGRHPLVLYVSVVLARCVGAARANPSSERAPASAASAAVAYPQHNHNIVPWWKHVLTAFSCTRSFPHRPQPQTSKADITHTPRGDDKFDGPLAWGAGEDAHRKRRMYLKLTTTRLAPRHASRRASRWASRPTGLPAVVPLSLSHRTRVPDHTLMLARCDVRQFSVCSASSRLQASRACSQGCMCYAGCCCGSRKQVVQPPVAEVHRVHCSNSLSVYCAAAVVGPNVCATASAD